MTLLHQLTLIRPRTPSQLHAWLRLMLDLDVPRRAMEPDNDAPFDYLCHAFFEDTRKIRDCCVWANRGGGKTMLAAVATLLDLLFKPGIKVCLLGGSFEQAARMHEHLAKFLEVEPFRSHVKRLTRDRIELANGSVASVLSQSQTSVRGWHVHRLRCDEVELFEQELWEAAQLTTRSGWCGDVFVQAGIEAFSTMHRAGGLMESLVERAARSGEVGHGDDSSIDTGAVGAPLSFNVSTESRNESGDKGAVSIADTPRWSATADPGMSFNVSTESQNDDTGNPAGTAATESAPKPFRVRGKPSFPTHPIFTPTIAARDAHGLQSMGFNMNSPFIDSPSDDPSFPPLAPARRLFRWGVLEVLERCGAERSCGTCVLFEECRGRAKSSEQRGFVSIDDVTIQKQRVSRPTWESEMLCRRPTTRDAVYAEFDPGHHVVGNAREPRVPIIASTCTSDLAIKPIILAGIDFGYRAPTVVLLAKYDPLTDQLLIFDELHVKEKTTDRIIEMTDTLLNRHGVPRPSWIGADPAGHQRGEHTGVSTVTLWKRAGFPMRTRPMKIEPGLDAVRARLRAADGSIRLRIHARCGLLVRALRAYRYPPGGFSEVALVSAQETPPLKDGPDHAADALRYLVTNLDRHGIGLHVRWS